MKDGAMLMRARHQAVRSGSGTGDM